MPSANTLTDRLQEKLDQHHPGQYAVTLHTGRHIQGGPADYLVTLAADGERGAVFHLDTEVIEEHGEEAAVARLYTVIEKLIADGLPEQRANAYLGYDAT